MQHQKRIICCCSIGALATIIGTVAIILIPTLISTIAHEKMALIPSNPSFPLWRDLDLPIYQKFYFYNVTNAKEVESNGAKPNLVEIGPFTFRMNLSKSALNFSDDLDMLQFREKRRFYFDRNLSSYDLDVTLTTLNVPLAVAYDTLDFDAMNPMARYALKIFLSKQSFFFTATVDELIFKGKTNPISCMAHLIDPVHNPDCRFMYFRGQNDTDDGLYEIFTGYKDASKINSIFTLNGSQNLTVWDGDECNKIEGSSNGELFPPLDLVPGDDKTLHFFRSDFCRVFNLTRTKTAIPSLASSLLLVDRFSPVEHLFANSSVNPANSCYKPKPNSNKVEDGSRVGENIFQELVSLLQKHSFSTEDFEHLFATNSNDSSVTTTTVSPTTVKPKPIPSIERPSGVFDLSACHDGVPILISWPHFLHADPYYLNSVTGLKPNLSLHETFIDVEPLTGTPVDFLARVQVNVDVQTELSGKKMKSLVFPALWQEFTIEITDAMAHQISSQTKTPRIAAFTIAGLVIVLGVILLLYGLFLIFIHFHRMRLHKLNGSEPLLGQEDDNQTRPEEAHFDREDSTNNNDSFIHD